MQFDIESTRSLLCTCKYLLTAFQNMVRTLYSLSELRDSGFGQPDPRHGLRLLWWFANKCFQVDFNGRLHALCDPKRGDFGFRRFYNGNRLLPHTNHPYYKTGNLNHHGSLPYYVTENDTGYLDDSNTDRIIVSLSTDCDGHICFQDIYVTQHKDQTHFDKSRTYRISLSLMKHIQYLRLAKFLTQMENDQNQIHYKQQCTKVHYYPSPARPIQNPTYEQQQRSSLSIKDICETCCTVLGLIALLLLFCIFVHFAKLR